MSDALPPRWWRDKDTLYAVVSECGSQRKAEDTYGVGHGVLSGWWKRHELPPLDPNVPAADSLAKRPVDRVARPAGAIDPEALLKALRKAGPGVSVDEIADAMDAAPRRVHAALTQLRADGYRVEVGDRVRLERVAPSTTSVRRDLLPLLDGKLLRVGVVSDTHLGSNEEALSELHAAYDWFAREGVGQVLHAGDWVTGLGVFRGQHAEIKVHTVHDQAEYAIREYPRRENVQTIGIAGNHDLEGAAGKLGYDPVHVIAAKRSDVTYLRGMSSWLALGEGQVESPPFVHLLHGKGGMSYAYSYKAQKLVDGYPGGRKPAILIPGHWHVRGSFDARSVQVLFPGCFEWQSPFMQRLGLHPAVGFHLLEVVVAADGSIVSFMPRWLRFYQGRVVG